LRDLIDAYIGVELTNEGGEVIVFEVAREQIAGEDGWIPDYEGRSIFVPRDDVINRRVVDDLVSFRQKWRRS